MNMFPPSKQEKESKTDLLKTLFSQKKVGKPHINGKLKEWMKKLPFFMEADYLRRKILDSTFFDFRVRSLADSLIDWPRYLLIDNTNRFNARSHIIKSC